MAGARPGGGGFIGGVGNNVSIYNCYATGTIISSNYAGGLAGYNYMGGIINCYATGNVSGRVVGGLVGGASYGKIANCYAAGDATGNYTGGLIGDGSYFDLVNCYWNKDKNDSGICVENGSSIGIGKTEAELKSQDFVDVLNENVTIICSGWLRDVGAKNQGFPILSNVIPSSKKYWLGNAIEPMENEGIYEIYSAGHLAWVSLQVSEGNRFEDKTVKLMNDIDLVGKEWSPIGGWGNSSNYAGDQPCFNGIFDGNYNKIKNMRIGTNEKPTCEYVCVGLFGSIAGGTIKCVGLENIEIYCEAPEVGAVVAYAQSSYDTIAECYSTGVINHFSVGNTGGLLGYSSHNSGRINDCFSTVSVSGKGNVGGLCGYIWMGNVINCYAIGDLAAGSDTSIGGLIGTGGEVGHNSYWNKNAIHHLNGFDLHDNSKKGIGNGTDPTIARALSELKIRDNFTDWDFDNTWSIEPSINGGLPYLRGFSMDNITVKSISLSRTSATLDIGDFINIYPVISPANATNQGVAWQSDNMSVAVVDSGHITAVGSGTARITAITADGNYTAFCDIKVNALPMDYTINSVTLRTTGGSVLSAIPASGDFIVRTNLTMNSVRSGDIIIVAIYDNNGRFLRIYQDNAYLTNYLDVGVPANFPQQVSQVTGKTISKIKAFIWDGANKMGPLSNVGNYPIAD